MQDARRDVPVVAISGDGGFMFTATELATAVQHRIPLTVVVFNDDAFGNVRRIQEERYGNRLIASDLTNPDFVRFAESFGAAAERARNPQELRAALDRALKRRDQPTLIEVPVGPLALAVGIHPPAEGAGLAQAGTVRRNFAITSALGPRVHSVCEQAANHATFSSRCGHNTVSTAAPGCSVDAKQSATTVRADHQSTRAG